MGFVVFVIISVCMCMHSCQSNVIRSCHLNRNQNQIRQIICRLWPLLFFKAYVVHVMFTCLLISQPHTHNVCHTIDVYKILVTFYGWLSFLAGQMSWCGYNLCFNKQWRNSESVHPDRNRRGRILSIAYISEDQNFPCYSIQLW